MLLERRGDWLVMAATLVRLKAALVAPASPEAAAVAEAEARRRLGQGQEPARMRTAVLWFTARNSDR